MRDIVAAAAAAAASGGGGGVSGARLPRPSLRQQRQPPLLAPECQPSQ